MLPLVDKPIIQYVIEEAVQSGLRNIILVTGRGKNAIEDHFDVAHELERQLEERGKTVLLQQVREISSMIDVAYVRQGQALGLGHAVLMARNLVGDEPFAVMLGDDVIDSQVPCMRQMIGAFERHGGPVIAAQRVIGPGISSYGVIDGTPEDSDERVVRVEDLVEKPRPEDAPSDLAIIGRYILTPDIFDILEETPRDARGEIQLTNALRTLSHRRPVFGYRFEGTRYDAGDKLGFLKATVELALKREDLGASFREYLRALKL